MDDNNLINLLINYEIRLVRRVGTGGTFEWVAFNGNGEANGTDLRQVLHEMATRMDEYAQKNP